MSKTNAVAGEDDENLNIKIIKSKKEHERRRENYEIYERKIYQT